MSSKKNVKQTEENVAQSKRKVLSKLEPQDAEMILETVPEETRIQLVERISMYSGPIPPPELLKQFDDVIPDGAHRIMKMAEDQSAHRQELEKSVVKAKNTDSRLGVIFAGIIGLVGLLSGAYLISIDKTFQGFIFSGTTLVSLVAVYLKGTNLDKEDLKNKRED